MVNLKEKPFYLNEEQIEWVEKSINEMTLDEKLQQLFIVLNVTPDTDEENIKLNLDKFKQGGLRWQGGNREQIYLQSKLYQENTKIPMLIAANCDDGGNGFLADGTFVATAAEASADESGKTAYHIGYVAAREATALGINWLFNPVVDIFMNWRNTIVNTRSFGDNADDVIKNSREYIKGVKDANPNIACCCKHFPGDGVEELDQHLVMGINNLNNEEWMRSFGRTYKTMIDEGIETVMVGHIALPDMSRKFRPGIKNEDIKPATLSPELLNDLLRGELGFNGLIVSDASHMLGIASISKRSEAVPGAIAAGCDMFLFTNDIDEDLNYMRKGVESGIITEERLSDALHRILGLKAKLNLNKKEIAIPDSTLKDTYIGNYEYKKFVEEAADRCITLVKDTRNNLPIDINKGKNAYLVYVGNVPTSTNYEVDPAKKRVIEEFINAGFRVDVCENYYELETENGPSIMNKITMLNKGSREEFKSKYDVVFLVININGYAQENNMRLRWSISHSKEFPWYNLEVPTIGISLNYTNHLIDIPYIKTFINAYGSNNENIRAAIEKICGKSTFNGKVSETVFCNRWDTRL